MHPYSWYSRTLNNRDDRDEAVHAVRKQILEILKETNGATVAELAAQLDMAPVSVRHHLDILQGDGLICVERVAHKGSVGRPQQIYALTAEANSYFPNNYASLAEHLVRQIKELVPPEQVAVAFQSMAVEIAAEMNRELVSTENSDFTLEERLERVTGFLTERGYLARWNLASSDDDDSGKSVGYLLHKHNCPYSDVSTEHSELCLMDQALINALLGQPCERINSMAENGGCCTYRIGVEASPESGPKSGTVEDEARLNVEWGDLSAPAPVA
jgi:predicted ArsR family transcriptional regulator